MLLMAKNWFKIPPGKPSVTGDISCNMKLDSPIHPFAFRTHAHSLGSVISGYKYNAETKEYTEIAKGSPQWPQAFYPTKGDFEVKSGEYLVARCTYNSTGKDKTVRIGMGSDDEMCNLYLMYYTKKENAKYRKCWSNNFPKIASGAPESSVQPPPHNTMLEDRAKHSHSKSKDLSQTGEEEHHHRKGSGRRKGDLDSPAMEPDEGVAAQEKALPPPPVAKERHFEIRMPGARPTQNDDYLCSAFSIKNLTRGTGKKKVYVTAFNAEATASKAHHLILQKCSIPNKEEGEVYNCGHHALCMTSSSIMYAWAKDAPPTSLPPDVGFELDENEDGYIVMQVRGRQETVEKVENIKLSFNVRFRIFLNTFCHIYSSSYSF